MMNVPSIIVACILVLIVIGIIAYMIKNRKKGCCGCSSDSCPHCKKNKTK